ncbi:hypothetical protein ACER0A_003065 [Haloimpatiens sp. FM7315]|uniref:DUF7852 domain-containing protein n=1 Tax=Haloimpatiens sp. FM7315 TaxID=3298609 RepID=UPI00370B1A4B
MLYYNRSFFYLIFAIILIKVYDTYYNFYYYLYLYCALNSMNSNSLKKQKTYLPYASKNPLKKKTDIKDNNTKIKCAKNNDIKNSNTNLTTLKVPKILKECILEIPLLHHHSFNEKVLEINEKKYSVKLLDYSIIKEPKIINGVIDSNENICHLFIKGFLIKDFKYTKFEDFKDSSLLYSIKGIREFIPFNFASFVKINETPLNNLSITMEVKEHEVTEYSTINKGEALVPSFNNSTLNREFFKKEFFIKDIESKIVLKLKVILIQKTFLPI